MSVGKGIALVRAEHLKERVTRAMKEVGLSVTLVSDVEELLRMQREIFPDLLVVETEIVGDKVADAQEFLEAVRSSAAWFDVPVLFCSPYVTVTQKALLTDKEASDVIDVNSSARLLLKRFQDLARLSYLKRQVRELEQELRGPGRASKPDSVTGLAQWAEFKETVASEVARAGRYDLALSLVLFSVDRLDAIASGNPDKGQDIRRVSARHLARTIRNVDRLGLLEQDFLVLLPMTQRMGATIMARRLQSQLVEQSKVYEDVTVSCAVVALDQLGKRTVDGVKALLVDRLQKAQSKGRGTLLDQ